MYQEYAIRFISALIRLLLQIFWCRTIQWAVVCTFKLCIFQNFLNNLQSCRNAAKISVAAS